MKPVLVLQHLVDDGPGYLGTWLRTQDVPVDIRCTEAGDGFPESVDGYRALAILGGSMSANDDLPSLRRAEDLIRQAVRDEVPMLGHCLGGQLMARALGASVAASPAPEVGWTPITVDDHAVARDWFGSARTPIVFQWHGEAFGLPRGAQRLARSACCPNQAFAVGVHLALQFHVEVDAAKIEAWIGKPDGLYLTGRRAHPSSVQPAGAMLAGIPQWLAAQQELADRLYRRWLALPG